jgi:hypothetical protein
VKIYSFACITGLLLISCTTYKVLNCKETLLRVPANDRNIFLVKIGEYLYQYQVDTSKVRDAITCENVRTKLRFFQSFHGVMLHETTVKYQKAGNFKYNVSDTNVIRIDSTVSVLREYAAEIWFTPKHEGSTILSAYTLSGEIIATSRITLKKGSVIIIP